MTVPTTPPAGGTFDLASGLTILRSTPAVLSELLAPLPEAWLDAHEGDGTWSARQVLRHLIWGEVDDWIPRVRLIYEYGEAQTFRAFDREAGFRHYERFGPGELLGEFARLRSESLHELERLHIGPDDLPRTGRHPEFGTVTLEQLLATWVTHDLTHITQIARVLTRHAGMSSGPWKAYFRVFAQSDGAR